MPTTPGFDIDALGAYQIRARDDACGDARAVARATLSLVVRTALLASVLVVVSPLRVHATPPSPPLELTLTTLETPRPGRPVRFSVEVKPLVPAELVRVRVVPPRDCALVEGDTLLPIVGPPPQRTERLDYAIRIPSGLRRYVYVRAELLTPGGVVYMRGENLVLLAGEPLEPQVVARPVSDGHGGMTLSFDGKPVATQGRPEGPKPPGSTHRGVRP